MKFKFYNFTDSDGYTWSTNGNPKIVNNCLKLDGKSYLFAERTDISNFGLGKFSIEYKVKPALEGKGHIMMIYSSPLMDPSLGYSAFEVSINQFCQTAIQISNNTSGLLRASGMDMTGIDLFDGKWHTIKCTRDVKGIIQWYHNGLAKNWANTCNWSDINITSTSVSHIGTRYDIAEEDQFKLKGLLSYLKITKH